MHNYLGGFGAFGGEWELLTAVVMGATGKAQPGSARARRFPAAVCIIRSLLAGCEIHSLAAAEWELLVAAVMRATSKAWPGQR